MNPRVSLIKSQKLFSYPADKKKQLTAFIIRKNQQVDQETLNRMFDKNTETQFTGEDVDDQPEGLTFHLDHHSIFKRLTLTFKSGTKASQYGKICLLLDDKPPTGDSTGCNPTFNSNTGEMTWEDFHMNIVRGSQN